VNNCGSGCGATVLSCEHSNIPSGFIKCGEFIDHSSQDELCSVKSLKQSSRHKQAAGTSLLTRF
jgi:hypothetical protein